MCCYTRICDSWRKAIDDKKLAGILLVDLSKAFDSLPHSLTIAKLHAYGVSENALTLIADYLTNRSQRTKVCSAVSDWSSLSKGVPQGSIIGPVLFNVFMNDIFYAIKNNTLFNYADDNTLLATGNSLAETIETLKNGCDNILNWVHTNEMEANPSKFQVMLSNDSNVPFKINDDVTITSEACVKLLGVFLDNKLTFNDHITHLCTKAAKQINVLQRLKRMLDPDVKLLLYKAFISCHFNYCPVVWHACGAVNTRKLEKLQYRALKFVFNDHSSTYDELLTKANMPTLEISRLRSLALEVFKALNHVSPSFICDIFKENVRTHRYNLRGNALIHSHSRTTRFGLHSFNHLGVSVWNSLPVHFRETTDFNTFKGLIKTWYGNSCRCSFCS